MYKVDLFLPYIFILAVRIQSMRTEFPSIAGISKFYSKNLFYTYYLTKSYNYDKIKTKKIFKKPIDSLIVSWYT